jgi:hypothetical protein
MIFRGLSETTNDQKRKGASIKPLSEPLHWERETLRLRNYVDRLL